MIIFNREKERKELTKIIKDNEFIFIDGISGVGKTVLIKYVLEKELKTNHYLPFSFKESDNKEEFFKFIYTIYSLRNDMIIDKLVSFNQNIGAITFKTFIENVSSEKELKYMYLPDNYRVVFKNDGYVEFFKKFWEVLDNKINIIWLSNLELVQDESVFDFIKAMILTKTNNIKIIFEKGTLVESDIFLKIKTQINCSKNIDSITIQPFDINHTRKFCKEFLQEKYCDKVYELSKGIPLQIEYSDSIQNIINYSYTNDEEKFLILLMLVYEFTDDFSFIMFISSLIKIKSIDLTDKKFKFIIFDITNNKISLSHPYIYFLLHKKFSLKIIEVVNELELLKNYDKALYFKIQVKFNHYKLLMVESREFIEFLADKLEEFKLIELDSYLSFEIKHLQNNYQEILNLIIYQVKIYNFDTKVKYIEFKNEQIKTLSFIIYLQKLYHDDEFQKVIDLIDKEFENIFLSIEDSFLLQYLNLTINAIKGVAFLAIGKYNEARNLLVSIIRNNDTKQFNNLYNYALNLLPAVDFHNALNDNDFMNYKSIENLYIRYKRWHNILALKLYDLSLIDDTIGQELIYIIDGFESIGSIELSYTINNQLVYYILTNNNKKAKEIIDKIQFVSFERYDQISLYNNAIIYHIKQNNYNLANDYFEKALKIIDNGFNDPSFVSKVYLNGAILYKLQNNEEYNLYLDKIINIIPEDYDDYILLLDKIKYIQKCNITHDFFFKDNENDILKKYIFWYQIIHFWDFDIPILNKQVIMYLLQNK